MRKLSCRIIIVTLAAILAGANLHGAKSAQPNIVIFLADDLGYGSTTPYGANPALVRTPAISRLAEQGMTFDQGYTTASVCSPTRYGLLTGSYSWRSRLQYGVVNSNDPLLVDPSMMTLPKWLQAQGYETAQFGKWHLGYKAKAFKNLLGEVSPGPNDVGFDYHFGVPNNMDDVHKVYIENRGIYGLRSDKISQYGKSFYGRPYTGYDAPQRNEPQVMEELTERAINWIDQRDDSDPFFLYFAAVAVHHPIMPSERMRGTSEAGAYGDFIHDVDYSVGQIMDALERRGLLDNTLFFFTSDNGGDLPNDETRPEIQAEQAGLVVNGPLRGDKHTIYEGGLRVPMIVSWPASIKGGTRSHAIVTTADFFATIAELVGTDTELENAAPDSFSFAGVLKGASNSSTRPHAVFRDARGRKAVRFGPWKFVDNYFPQDQEERGSVELYNIDEDLSESKDLAKRHPEIVTEGQKLLKTLQSSPSR